MRSQKVNYVVVGIFVTAMLSAAIGAVILLGGRTIAHDNYMIVLDNVSDVKFGTQVRYEGYPVGQVEAIRPHIEDNRTRFQLEVSVEKGWRIPADSVARIASSNFLGAKTVDITAGEADQPLAPGARIAGAPAADMFSAMASLAAEFGELSHNDLKSLVKRVANLVDTANSLVDTDLRGVISSANGVATQLERQVPAITSELLHFTGQLNTTFARMQKILSQRNVESAEHIIHNVEEASTQFLTVSRNLQGTLGRLDAIFADVGQITKANNGKVNSVVEDARYTLRAIATNIDAINHNLAGTARNMNEFSRLIRQNPGLLLGSSPRKEVETRPVSSQVSRERP